MGGSGMVVVGRCISLVVTLGATRAAPDSPQAAPNKMREQSGRAAHSAYASFTRRSLHSIELRMGSACYLLVLLAGLASAHEYFPEKCPAFTPMQGFDWDQVTLYLQFFQKLQHFGHLFVIFSLLMVCGT